MEKIIKISVSKFFLLAVIVFISVNGLFAQNGNGVTLNLKKAPLKELFDEIQRQTDLNFVYNSKDTLSIKPITIDADNKSVVEILEEVFKNNGFKYHIEGKIISIKYTPPSIKENEKKVTKFIPVIGRVTDNNNEPLPGVNIWLKGTNTGAHTDSEGMFVIKIPDDTTHFLVFTFLGMKDQTIQYSGQQVLNVVLEEDIAQVNEVSVVATGMFTRNSETFTGAATSYSAEELKSIGSQNILASLKILDPAFSINESTEFGSDPNMLPDIQLRGPSSIDIEGEYSTSPNQPLFILNGFETTVEKVYDMDMNLVESITLLKDAAAKAIYGSKAANGVVIIETKQPERGTLRASYNGSIDITVPDLTSYNLTNAAEKLQAEVLAGKYTSTNAYTQAQLTKEYNERYKEVARGVDSYWMSQPLRLGVGQKHSVLLDGGDDAMRYSANLSYNNIAGVMIGSSRTTISGNITLAYRHKKLSFRNNLSIDNNEAVNSPYGRFSSYSKMNPYWRIYNDDGNLIKVYDNNVYNPLFDAKLNSKDESTYSLITENFYGEWNIVDNLRLTARLGYSKNLNSSDLFIPASNTQYANISVSSDEYLLRGKYTQMNGSSQSFSADAGLSYSIHEGNHLFYTNVLYNIEQSVTETSGMTVVGFPSDKMDYISFGSQFAEGSSASGDESTVRSVGGIASINYSYDNRYLTDASYRLNGSSMFGAKERWGSFWSLGLGWNLHNEAFMRDVKVVNQFKVRASLGYTGSQNFNSYQAITSYSYLINKTYNGDMGVVLKGLANDELRWQQVYDRNIGADMSILDNTLSVRIDLYNALTTNLLTDVTLPPSSGFSTYRENLGETINKGFELNASFRVWSNSKTHSSLNIFGGVSHNTNKISKISDALKKLNEEQDKEKEGTGGNNDQIESQQTPSTRYEEGQSMTAIWAVISKGIDPITGQEVFVTKDGATTFNWSTSDQVVCGDATPKFKGNLGLNLRHKGFSMNCAFTYRFGGQIYNSTLVNKVENVDVLNDNVDKRVLTDRWNTPGVPAKFKSITDYSITKPTSRFVEDLNELIFSSLNFGYDFSETKLIKESPFEYLEMSFNTNDIGRLTSVKQEFGLSYPRARVFSFLIRARF